MNLFRAARAFAITGGLIAVFSCIAAAQPSPAGQSPEPVAAAGQAPETQTQSKGLPPRAAASDYQSHGQAGKVTIGAEFKSHSIPTPEATFTSEDYIAVEVGIFGPPETRLTLSPEDFSLRVINKGKGAIAMQAKKIQPLPTKPYALVFNSLKDPSWEPPAKVESKSKTSIGGGGDGGNGNDPPPAPPKMPFELVRAMQQKVQKATLPEGDRVLPVAGLIYFSFHGKTENIRVLQLIYSGPAGQATLDLQPE